MLSLLVSFLKSFMATWGVEPWRQAYPGKSRAFAYGAYADFQPL